MSNFDPQERIRTVSYTNRKTGKVVEQKILDAAPRIAWFRDDYPASSGWAIVTECVLDNEKGAEFKAQIINADGKVIATGHKFCSIGSFDDYRGKAETQAIARAVSNAGYGTITALEFGEDDDAPEKLPDSPVTPKRAPLPPNNLQPAQPIPSHNLHAAGEAEKKNGNGNGKHSLVPPQLEKLFKSSEARKYENGKREGARGVMCGKLDEFSGDTQRRRTFLLAVCGKSSSTELTDGQIYAVNAWLSYPTANAEVNRVINEYFKLQGQQELSI